MTLKCEGCGCYNFLVTKVRATDVIVEGDENFPTELHVVNYQDSRMISNYICENCNRSIDNTKYFGYYDHLEEKIFKIIDKYAGIHRLTAENMAKEITDAAIRP